MCGIIGLWDPSGTKHFSTELVTKMNRSQQHRGPDDEGYFIQPGIALGHRRLSIIDLNTGQQPVFNENNQVVVVFNGEIYNFKVLKKMLEVEGHQFKTHTDTEVIVHAYESWKERCVDYFRGMFAFLLWDIQNKTLFVARDRLGVKPLYYAELPDGTWIFSSELKAFYPHPDFKKAIRLDAVMDYFAYGYVPEPKTIYEQSFKLEPGHFLSLKNGQRQSKPIQYWDVPFNIRPQKEEEAIETLSEYLKESVALRMIADVPLGAFLSGGVDSSAVVSTMAQLSTKPIRTCSIQFDVPSFDESIYANQIAKQFNTDHKSYQVDLGDFSLLQKMHQIYDEPFADSSALPTYRVCEVARREVKVALSGDGGDENFAGYRRYKGYVAEESFKQYLPLSVRRPVFTFLEKTYPQFSFYPRFLRAKSTFKSLSFNALEGYFNTIAIFKDVISLFSPDFLQRLDGYHPITVLAGHAANAPHPHPLCFAQYLDIKTYLVGDILTKVDRASMAHGLEVREPLLDHKMIEWASSLPPDLKLNKLISKYILKKTLEKQLPQDILYRRKKGFSVPLNHWFREGLRDKIIKLPYSTTLERLNFFNKSMLVRLIHQHLNHTYDHSAVIWALLVFENFIENLEHSERKQTDAYIACA